MNLEREFSRAFAPSERDQLAQDIKKARQQHRRLHDEWSETEAAAAGPDIEHEFAEQRSGFVEKILKLDSYKEKQRIWTEVMQRHEGETIENLYRDFHERLDHVLERTPLTAEEQDQLLSEESVSQMNLDDYLTLLKRLSGQYVSHVTRYGVREHTFQPGTGGGHWYGEGKFIDNFTPLLQAKEVQGFLSNIVNRTEYAMDIVRRELAAVKQEHPDADQEKIISATVDRLMFEPFTPGDTAGPHVAAGDIANTNYGSEHGYDMYIYYPAEVIAKNYPHHGNLQRDLYRNNQQGYNDHIIWNGEKGIPIDAGIVCIPEDATVDAKTGSQYALDDEQRPIEIPERSNHQSFIREHREEMERAFFELRQLQSEVWGSQRAEKAKVFQEKLQQYSEQLHFFSVQEFSRFFQEYGHVIGGDNLKRFYQSEQLLYQQPDSQNRISSREYWEQYFADHPDSRPSKVLYYPRHSHFKPIPQQTPEKDKVYTELAKQTQLSNIAQHPDYAAYREKMRTEVTAVVESQYAV